MKKLIAIMLVLVLALSMAACGGNGKAPAEGQASSVDGGDENGQIQVDEGLFNVTVTIPANYVEDDVTQESIEKDIAEKKYKSATINEDGSVTYVMSKSQHNKMLNEFRDRYDESLEEMSENNENIASVKAEKDYTHFTITLNSGEPGFEESFAVLGFVILSGYYYMLKGEEVPEISVDYVDGNTGEIVNSWNSGELSDDAEE